MAHTIYVARGKKQFKLTFDEEGYLDEVWQVWRDKEPKQLNGKNADVKHFVVHQHKMAVGSMPDGTRHIRQGELV